MNKDCVSTVVTWEWKGGRSHTSFPIALTQNSNFHRVHSLELPFVCRQANLYGIDG